MGKAFVDRTPHDRPLAGWHVLVVEDEFFIAQDLERAVRRRGGFVVGPVATCAEALALLATARIDVAVVDIDLSGTPAYPLVDALSRRAVPVVFATGFTEELIGEAYRHLPRWVKPYPPDALAAGLNDLGRARADTPAKPCERTPGAVRPASVGFALRDRLDDADRPLLHG